MPPRSYDVAIVGGGIAGVASAHRLAPDHDVVVVDAGAVGAGTTSRASGVITTPAAYPDHPEMGELAIDFFETFDDTGIFDFHRRVNVEPITPDAEAFARDLSERDGIKYLPADVVAGTDADVFTDLSDHVGVLRFEDTGMIDVADYIHSLKHVAESEGAEFRTNCAVKGVRRDGVSTEGGDGESGTVTGLDTEYGPIDADAVVCAAGWHTRHVLDGIMELPTRPCRWNAILVDPEATLPTDYPMGQSSAGQFYWRPTHEGYLLVGGNEYPVDDPEGLPSKVRPEFRARVAEHLDDLLRGLDNLRVVREDCCPTGGTATPDTMMILDAPADGPDGLVVATGFQGIGVMSSPCIAEGVRSLVTGERCPFPLGAFRLDRFDSRSPDFEFVSGYNRYKF